MHGSFSRADTWNFMAMQGPDFKSHFVDPAPASNADLGRTIAQLMQLDVSNKGKLVGRVLAEATAEWCVARRDQQGRGLGARAERACHGDWHADGREHRYFDAAGFPGRTVGLPILAPGGVR